MIYDIQATDAKFISAYTCTNFHPNTQNLCIHCLTVLLLLVIWCEQSMASGNVPSVVTPGIYREPYVTSNCCPGDQGPGICDGILASGLYIISCPQGGSNDGDRFGAGITLLNLPLLMASWFLYLCLLTFPEIFRCHCLMQDFNI